MAFTIEADNEAERTLPHLTTSFGATGERGSVWLTSLAMWFNCLRGLADTDQLTVAELEQRVGMPTNLDGMRRWGYITIDGVGRVRRGEKRPEARRGSVLALTRRGRAAEAVWRPLTAAVERRWRERFGADPVGQGCGRRWWRSPRRSMSRFRTSYRLTGSAGSPARPASHAVSASARPTGTCRWCRSWRAC